MTSPESIPRNKPNEMWAAEWVVRHWSFEIEGVTDTGFLAEFKLVMIEILGDRLYDYRAVEILLGRIKSGAFLPMAQFPPDHVGYRNLKCEIDRQMSLVRNVALKWRNEGLSQSDQASSIADSEFERILEVEIENARRAYEARQGQREG